MLKQTLTFLHDLPFWVWVVVPALIFAGIAYFLSHKNIRTTLVVLLATLLGAWSTAGFHWWEVYLHEHVIGRYDEYGIPTQFSDSGFGLLLDAWPLWAIPVVTVLVLYMLGSWIFHRLMLPKLQPTVTKAKKKQETATAQTVALKLELIQLKEEHEKLKRQSGIGDKAMSDSPSSNDSSKVKALQQEVVDKNEEIEALQEELVENIEELEKAKTLIESLLEDKLDKL